MCRVVNTGSAAQSRCLYHMACPPAFAAFTGPIVRLPALMPTIARDACSAVPVAVNTDTARSSLTSVQGIRRRDFCRRSSFFGYLRNRLCPW